MTYAFSLYNGVMPLGLNAMGSSASFKGNGMCFSTRGLRRIPWRSYGLVEDMEYSWTLRLAGERIHFESGASVYGAMVGSGQQAAANQRRRWEFGRKEIDAKFLGQFLRARNWTWWEKRFDDRVDYPINVLAGDCLRLGHGREHGGPSCRQRFKSFPSIRGFIFAFPLVMTAALVAYAVAPFLVHAIALAIWFESCLLPILFRLEDCRFSRRSTPTSGFAPDASLGIQPNDHGHLARGREFLRGSVEHHDGRSLVQTTQDGEPYEILGNLLNSRRRW